VAVLGAALALLAGGVTHAGPVLGISAAGVHAAFRGGDETAGWSFTTSQAITVTALDAFDPSGYGNVRLYDGIGDVLASATLTTADPTEAAGSYWFYTQAITPVTLQAGQTYYVAEDFKVGVTHALAKAVLTTSPLITYGDGVGANGAGWTPTRDNNNGAYNPSYFGPNFDAAPAVSAAPEPASLALLATGALGLLGYGWRRRQAA
jgi:hypothetical protein